VSAAAKRDLRVREGRPAAAIWLVCHYPDHAEADERVQAAAELHRVLRLPIWLFGSASARYPESVEGLLRKKLLAEGIPAAAVMCSADRGDSSETLDTAQEAVNVLAAAQRDGITTLVCVSNRLQLLQVRGLLRKAPVRLVLAPVPLRDRRWWYVLARLALIPLAFAGAGHRFWPLVLLRRARARLVTWRF
jgi:hypothetical protein